MAQTSKKSRPRRKTKAPPDREALGLVLLTLGIVILGVLLPQVPTGGLLNGPHQAAVTAVGVAVWALPLPLFVLGGLFVTRRQPPAWPRVLGGYALVGVGVWLLVALFSPALAGTAGIYLHNVMNGALGVLAFLGALLVASLGVELILNWPPTTIARVASTRTIEFLRTAWRSAMQARGLARERAAFHADVVLERQKLRELDRDLAALAGLYPNSGEVTVWRRSVDATRQELLKSPGRPQLEDARLDVTAWAAAIATFTRDRATELGSILAAEGVPRFDDWVREMKAELDDSSIEPVAPARALDELRNALTLDLTALHERHRRLTRERDLAEPTLKDIRARDLPKVTAQHEERRKQYLAVEEDARELQTQIESLPGWRELMHRTFLALRDHPGYEELSDYSGTLAGEIREKGRDVLQQLPGWQAALAAVVQRAVEEAERQSRDRRLAEERAVEERVRGLGSAAAAEQFHEQQVASLGSQVRWPREKEDRPVDYASPSRRVAEAEAARTSEAVKQEADRWLPLDREGAQKPDTPAQEPLEPAASATPPWTDPDDQPMPLADFLLLDPDPEPEVEAEPEPARQAPKPPVQPSRSVLADVPEEKHFDEPTDIPAVGGIPIQLPPYTLLDPVETGNGSPEEQDREMRERVKRIDETLANFRLEGRVVASVRGPTVTRFEVEPAPGEKISRFANLSDDLALAMAASSVRIEAPIPGKSVIGLEVPNANRNLIRFREAAEAPGFRRNKARLPLILGKSIDGEMVVADLSRMPHLLIAGSTGSGKSVAVNTLVGSLLYKFLPTELRFLMIDPKMVELTPYDGVPHLLRPVVTNPNDAAAVLLGAVSHMERRYKMMSKIGAKNLDQYNEKARNLDLPQLPFVIIIIDELADLMITSPKEVESAIMRLAQMARATGMHLVLATQRPSVDILTSLIKVNVPARMAFAVSSGHDSRTILDTMGAERLVGMGDMLYYQPGLVKPVRLQGPFISETEITALADFLRRQYFEDEFVEAYGDDFDPPSLHESDATGYVDWNDDKLRVAAELVVNEGQASVSRLQRRLQVGHARAGKLMDSLEALGVVGPHTGSKPREVLVAFEELPDIFGK